MAAKDGSALVEQQNQVGTVGARLPKGACGSAQRYSKGCRAQVVRKTEVVSGRPHSERPPTLGRWGG